MFSECSWLWSIPWSLVNLAGITTLKKADSLSQQPSEANRSSARARASCSPPRSMLGFCLVWVCTGLVYVVTSAMGLHV